jgi:hypothetical protein
MDFKNGIVFSNTKIIKKFKHIINIFFIRSYFPAFRSKTHALQVTLSHVAQPAKTAKKIYRGISKAQ